ncbi:hypothetical protein MMC10_010453 [Thelotrema lepadinum]|nr:hypothetical protein [Thelotrema lepadinum]
MGSGTSKPTEQSTQHIFKSDTPVRFSQEVLDKLQHSTETDSTRATDLELHIQSRVASELQRLAASTEKLLRDTSSDPSSPTPTSSKDPKHPKAKPWPTVSDPSIFPDPDKNVFSQPRSPLSSPSSSSNTPPSSSTSPPSPSSSSSEPSSTKPEFSRASVQASITSLQKKLQERKIKEEVAADKGVEKAKGEMVACLRANDRRPLDCWEEVKAFREEVGRLEGGWLGRVLE